MFELVKGTQAASLYIAKEADDFAGLSHVAEKIQKDIELVTGVAPKIRRKTGELCSLSCGRR